ncbi:MAG: holo-ACP synthase [Alphaproteobacteria bacterium]|nr:holo-ACP synthase [Rickettsiales bacterium]
MVVGLGIDIVNKDRIARLLGIYGKKFVDRIFSIQELNNDRIKEIIRNDTSYYDFCDRKSKNHDRVVSYVAKRFAAKEAVAKAIGCGIGKLSFKDIHVFNDNRGKPVVPINAAIITALFHNESVKGAMERFGDISQNVFDGQRISINVSISDEKDNAVCMVIIEYIK